MLEFSGKAKIQNIMKQLFSKLFRFRDNYNFIVKSPMFLRLMKRNKFLGHLPKMKYSRIIFKGKNNLLYCEKGVKLRNSNIEFAGNNSIIYLSKSHCPYKINLFVNNNNSVYIGKNNYFNSGTPFTIICSENKNVFIGNNNLFSLNICLRNADAHLIYDCTTKKRLNYSKSIYIGDHIWICQNTSVFKGTKIHSGSIVGANSIVNKELLSNSIYAGSKIELIKKNTFWTDDCVHKWTDTDTVENTVNEDDLYIYDNDDNYLSFDDIEMFLNKNKSTLIRLEYLKSISGNYSKNRFSLVKNP